MLTEQISQRALASLSHGRWTTLGGQVTRVMPTFIEADGPRASPGSLCAIGSELDGGLAEVIQVDQRGPILAPLTHLGAVTPGAEVRLLTDGNTVPVGAAFLGRVIDGLARPIDGGASINSSPTRSLSGRVLSPLERSARAKGMCTGIRAIDTLLPLGIGQRIGIFAGSGVGKSTLMGALASSVASERLIICLVGERGREAEVLWNSLDEARRARTTMIVATADQPAAVRVRATQLALAMAEYLRDEGLHVALLLDSVTRFAMALREVGLAAGEPPTLRAYTPSVFAALPRMVERCGALKSGGAISAVMSVLTEDDDADDPLAEVMKSLLDGHIILSRELAEQGHYPAIDAPRSVSRFARDLLNDAERRLSTTAIAELSLYTSSRTLIESGLYSTGAQPMLDRALEHRPQLLEFLRQEPDTISTRVESFNGLSKALGAL